LTASYGDRPGRDTRSDRLYRWRDIEDAFDAPLQNDERLIIELLDQPDRIDRREIRTLERDGVPRLSWPHVFRPAGCIQRFRAVAAVEGPKRSPQRTFARPKKQ
jgi:hypothetical protein